MFTEKNIFSVIIVILMITLHSNADSVINYRLPATYIPKHYNLSVELNPDSTKFSGIVVISMETNNYSSPILLHASPKRITNIQARVPSGQNCNTKWFNNKSEIYQISCPNLKNGENKIILKFSGVYGTENSDDKFIGLYKASYKVGQAHKNYLVTQFEPTFARTMFPCFDEPRFKAKFTISVTHPKTYRVLGNMKEILTTTKGSK